MLRSTRKEHQQLSEHTIACKEDRSADDARPGLWLLAGRSGQGEIRCSAQREVLAPINQNKNPLHPSLQQTREKEVPVQYIPRFSHTRNKNIPREGTMCSEWTA